MNIPAAEAHLKQCDPVLGRAIDALELTARGHEPDAWCALVSSICGQQISVHAARAVRGRVAALEPDRDFPSPHFVLNADDETLRGAGLSRAKVLAVRDLAAHLEDGRLQPAKFETMNDEDIIAALIPVRGIGRWTAEMFLIFSLQREDVLAVDDLGLRNAMKRLYDLPDLSPAEMRRIAEPWRPYRSVASWYLWQWLDNAPKIAAGL
ncbi:MAG TPA: DNA-3-methyladenine glycosylase [Abditibacteriaceae bacterium]|jgi:DNA-3-methyladenine glycosylase II